MFLRATNRRKDGKDHRYFSIVENRRVSSGRVVQRRVLYLGEINDSQQIAWRKSLEVFDETQQRFSSLSLFPDDREVPVEELTSIQVKLAEMELRRPRAFGNCWLGCELWRQLGLDEFWRERLSAATKRETVPWEKVLELLMVNRLIEPGSEFRLHRHWFERSAMADLLKVDFAVAEKDRLYRCLDRLLACKQELFVFLRQRWQDLFQPDFEVLLYDLTSTYIEGEGEGIPKAQYGYSQDKRFDCRQVVIGLVVTRSGLPLGYEVFAGNQAESPTLEEMMAKMEALYGKASRIWVFDRGVASERNLEALRRAGGLYLVGTPRTLLRKVEAQLLEENWTTVREGIEVKRVASPDGSQDTFILCRSTDRRAKEAAIHDRFEQRIEDKLARIQAAVQSGRLRSRDVLQQRLGRLKLEYSRVARAYSFQVEGDGASLSLSWAKNTDKAQFQRHSEGAYLLRTNLVGHDEPELWRMYMQLNDAEAAFRTLKQDLSIRPVFHQTEHRVKAHVLVCFLAYAMYRTLDRLAKTKGLDLTARRILDSLATIKSGDIVLPLVDGRQIKLRRVSRPDSRQAEILTRLGLELPERVGTDTVHAPDVVQTRP